MKKGKNKNAESEFEDCLRHDLYFAMVKEKFGVDLQKKAFRNNNHKWSTRLKNCFEEQGKRFTDTVKNNVKLEVAECVRKNPENALCEHKGSSIQHLIATLEELLSKK